MNTTTVISDKTKDGSIYQISITQTQGDQGSISIVQTQNGVAVKHENFSVYDIRANTNTSSIGCYAIVFGNHPWVTFLLKETAVAVTITGAIVGNGTSEYPMDETQIAKLHNFIALCHFPEAAW